RRRDGVDRAPGGPAGVARCRLGAGPAGARGRPGAPDDGDRRHGGDRWHRGHTAHQRRRARVEPGGLHAVAMNAPLESDIHDVGTRLARAFPSTSRNPVKALDARAMDLATQDAELRAALFRFVDVVPACRSLDDLAAHLTGFLDEVGDRPPTLEVAMRMSGTKAGRTGLGAAAAAGVRHMAHRFIVGETPRDATPVLQGLWKDGVATSVDLLGEATVTSAEADRYATRCREALEGLVEVYLRL